MSSAVMDGAVAGRESATGRFSALWQRVVAEQEGRSFLWCAPALAAGIGIYFALPSEPGIMVAAFAALLGILLLWYGAGLPMLMPAGMVLLGFALIRIEAAQHDAPILAATTGEVGVTGEVVSVERSSRSRHVMVLGVSSIEGMEAENLPSRLRLTLTDNQGLPAAGTEVSVRARLAPLPAPVMPGGFDFGRTLWFEGIGGTGRVTSAVTVLAQPTGAIAHFHYWMSGLRQTMGARIHASLREPSASFAEALITGERSAIPPEINRSLMTSGLYHILSISGLHMWLVAGGVFWFVRAALALWPPLALRYPIRKWAAAAALAMGFFYMLLADSGVATARAFLMVAIVFFAIMVDRPALSMRNLALAALVILIMEPQSVALASFQMSFLAVMGLVAFYEGWSRFQAGRPLAEVPERNWPVRLLRWALGAFVISLITALVAGLCSTLPAAYHFGRIAPYSVLANGLAIPVVGVLVMPAAVLAVLLMPLGLEWLPLAVMSRGLELVVAISDAIAGLPNANEVIASPPSHAMVVMTAGLIMVCLLAGSARLVGLGVMLVALMLAVLAPAGPALFVEASGRNVALRDSEGNLVPAHPRRGRFAVEAWLQSNGEETGLQEAARRPGWLCDGALCSATVSGKRVAYVSGTEAPPSTCPDADVLITDIPLRGACANVPLRIDRFDVWRQGAHALDLYGSVPLIRTARGEQGARPWTVSARPRMRPVEAAGD